jgi:Protein of unknown function (DUF4058)
MAKTSPFPGLDPYMELHWGDAHHSLIQYARDSIQGPLPDDLIARVEQRVYVERGDYRLRHIVPDVRLSEAGTVGESGGSVAVASEVEVESLETESFAIDPLEITEGFIEIREGDGGRVVTVIEFLSPANKVPGPGRTSYEQKQLEVLQSQTNLVEIDLVRAGRRVLALPPSFIPNAWRKDSLVCVRKSWRRDRAYLTRLPLRKRLPAVPIPLRETDSPVMLDLQTIHDLCYTNGRYGRSIDYTRPPEPPLAAEDAKWAADLLRSAGKTPPEESRR